MFHIKYYITFILCIFLNGCSAINTAANKHDLDVNTQMSSTVMLNPVKVDDKTVYLQLRNTSDHQELSYQQPLAKAIRAKGYHITEDPEAAHYWLQVNILQISRTDLRTVNGRNDKGYGAAIQGAEVGSAFGDGDGRVAAVIVGGLVGILTDALVTDIEYVMVTDIQISEKAATDVAVNESTETNLVQGDVSSSEQYVQELVDRKKYQTRITSTANQVNLSFEEAKQQLLTGLVQALSGLL